MWPGRALGLCGTFYYEPSVWKASRSGESLCSPSVLPAVRTISYVLKGTVPRRVRPLGQLRSLRDRDHRTLPPWRSQRIWEASGEVDVIPTLSPAVRSPESEAVSFSSLGPRAATAGSLGPPCALAPAHPC